MNKFVANIAAQISTVFGLGFCTFMPGTVGSGAAALVSAIVPVPWWVIVLTSLVGIWAANISAPALAELMVQKGSAHVKEADPGCIIIDEVVGQWISVLFLPRNFVIPGFFMFRLVDILKPWPVSAAERLPRGWGIMADDVVGGVLVNIFLTALYAYFGHAGWIYKIFFFK